MKPSSLLVSLVIPSCAFVVKFAPVLLVMLNVIQLVWSGAITVMVVSPLMVVLVCGFMMVVAAVSVVTVKLPVFSVAVFPAGSWHA